MILWLNLLVVLCFGDRLHNANLKARISLAKVAITTHALSDVTAFSKAAASSILRSLLSVKDRLSEQFCQRQGCFSRVLGRFWNMMLMMFFFKCVLLANIKRRCWASQVVQWGDVLVYTNDVLQCLHPNAYKASKWCGRKSRPTIFDIIDPTTTVSADSSQGNEALFGVNAGKQCVAMSLTAITIKYMILVCNCGLIRLWIIFWLWSGFRWNEADLDMKRI